MRLIYRPEIDGLRAIAVCAVILYHAQITIWGHQPFGGGFIGVDIFFVISGYLITSIILKELFNTGSFSFKYFYERRARRILPALLLVMLISLPFAWMYLMPSSLIDFSKSILYALGFGSNFYFHFSGLQYSNDIGLLKPFLHIWSLSVEEQYYILLPIVLLVAFKYLKKYLIHILILGFVISLGLADWGSKNHPSFNFYILPSRIWELIAGSILAYFEITKGYRSKNKLLNLILPVIGLTLIGYSILFFDHGMFHPSFYTLLPIIGTCFIIWFSNKNRLITTILSSRLFVGVGLISYSLYLWHYPIFTFAKISEFTKGSLFNKLILVIILFIISTLTYYLVERPARNINNKFKIVLSLLLIFTSIIFVLNLNIIQKKGYQDRVHDVIKNYQLEGPTFNYLKSSNGEICFGNVNGCKFNTSSFKKIYILGDSQLASLAFNLKNRVIKNNYQFIALNFPGCIFFPGFNKIDIKTKKIDPNCNEDYFQKIKKILIQENNSIIIIGGVLPLYLSNDELNSNEADENKKQWNHKFISQGKYDNIKISFQNEIIELAKNNNIILVYPIPEVGWNPPSKLFNTIPKNLIQQKNYLVPKNYLTTSYESFKNRAKTSFELLNSIKSDNIYRVYPHILFCDTIIKNKCLTHDDKNLFYFDSIHPSLEGAKMINDLIMQKIEKIERKSN